MERAHLLTESSLRQRRVEGREVHHSRLQTGQEHRRVERAQGRDVERRRDEGKDAG